MTFTLIMSFIWAIVDVPFVSNFKQEYRTHRDHINRIDETYRSQCFEAVSPVNKWSGSLQRHLPITQQLTKMYVKQIHLLVICKGWSFTKENNL